MDGSVYRTLPERIHVEDLRDTVELTVIMNSLRGMIHIDAVSPFATIQKKNE